MLALIVVFKLSQKVNFVMANSFTSNINYTFKMLYVIAIFMIVDGHIGNYDFLTLNGLIPYQNFHIGLFAFTSGYFLNLRYSYGSFFVHKFSRLILPLYLWNLVYGLLCLYLNKYHHFSIGNDFSLYNLLYAPIVDGHQFIYNMGAWFLIPLFIVQIISFIILKPFIFKTNISIRYLAICFMFFSLLLSGFVLSYGNLYDSERNLILTFLRSLYFLPFYAGGFLYRHYLEKYDNIPSVLYFPIILTFITLLYVLYPQANIIPAWLDYIPVSMFVIYLIAFLAVLFWLRIAKIMTPIIKNSPTLIYISNHTFDIMMHHFIGFLIIKASFAVLFRQTSDVYKYNIWHYDFPFGEHLTVWIYIFIAFLTALTIGFTSRKFYNMLAINIYPSVRDLYAKLCEENHNEKQ